MSRDGLTWQQIPFDICPPSGAGGGGANVWHGTICVTYHEVGGAFVECGSATWLTADRPRSRCAPHGLSGAELVSARRQVTLATRVSRRSKIRPDSQIGADTVDVMSDDEIRPAVRDALALGGDAERIAEYYDQWADTYDADLLDGYGGGDSIVATLRDALDRIDDAEAFGPDRARVLDAGCGTGLVGAALHAIGYRDLHGVDLSHEMVAAARRRDIYVTLAGGVDLTAPPADLVGSADLVVLGGVLAPGHVPPRALSTIASLARSDGLVVASVRQAYLDETDFHEHQAELCRDGDLALVVHRTAMPYTNDSTGDYYVWRVSESDRRAST